MSSYLQLCQDLHREVGASGTGPAAVTGQAGENARIVRWIADADQMIQSLWDDWRFLWTELDGATVATTREYSVADVGLTLAAFARWDADSFVLSPTLSTHSELRPLDYYQWRKNQKLGVITADRPARIVVKPDNALVFYPTPDAAYDWTADYYAAPVRMSANADVSAIPAHLHRIIVARAKMFYGAHEDAPEVYADGNTEFVTYLRRLEGEQLPNAGYKSASRAADMDVIAE